MTDLPITKDHRIAQIEHGRRSTTKGVVIHSTEGTLASALSWFESRLNLDGVGAHAIFDRDVTYQLADLDARCYHAIGANSEWVGFEHVGFARWRARDWLTKRAMILRSANRAAWVLYHYGLGKPEWGVNIRRHASFPAGGHVDPGPGFPVRVWMRQCRKAYANLVRTKGKRW